MGVFHPKEVFKEAREAEKHGKHRVASAQYSSLSAYLRRKGKLQEAKTVIERAIHLTPDSPRLYVQLVLCELEMNNLIAARKATETFSRLALQKEKVAEYTAYLEAQLKDQPSLRELFYQARLELDRTTAAPFLALAASQIEQGKLEPAKKNLLDALKTRTQENEVLATLKGILQTQRQEEALFHVRNYESGKLALPDLLILLSPLRSEKRDAHQPVVESRGKEEEKNLSTLIKELEENMGISLEDDHDSVAPLIREFRRKSDAVLQGDSKARIDMAFAFFEMGLSEDAQDELSPIGSTDPDYLNAQMLLGEILFAEGSDLGALEAFQRCLRDERANEDMRNEAKYKLVQVFLRLGDPKQAFRLAVELEKTSPSYRELRRYKEEIEQALKAQGGPSRGRTSASIRRPEGTGARKKR